MPPNVRLFAGFTPSLAFRYSVIFIVRLKKFQSTPPVFGLSSSLSCSFRDFGCGKAMSFDGLFRRDRPNKTLLPNRTAPMKRDKNSRYEAPMNPSERIDQLIAEL